MPVDKCAVWIWLPRPNVQGVEGRETEAIRTFEVVIKLAHELRRALPRMGLVPLIGQDQKIGASQLKMAVRSRFVNDDLGLSGVDAAAAHQSHVHVVKSHRSPIGAGHAAEQKGVPLGLCYRDIFEPCC